MAKQPKTVFLMSEDGYREISYTEFTQKYKTDEEYMKSHFFARFGDNIMELS